MREMNQIIGTDKPLRSQKLLLKVVTNF